MGCGGAWYMVEHDSPVVPSALHEAVKDVAEGAVPQVMHQPCKAAME